MAWKRKSVTWGKGVDPIIYPDGIFLPFRPGLVGGHCIGVDPYYLTYKAETVGYHPQVILAGRRINDGMGKFIAEKTVKMMIRDVKSILDIEEIQLRGVCCWRL